MPNLQSPAVPALVLRRTFAAPRERVFAAWTTPEVAARIFSPGDMKATDVRIDARIGGSFSITMLAPDGERFAARGTYREVTVPERLVMTWRWEEDDATQEYDSLLTLEFYPRDGGTELVLTHEKLATLESRARHEEGWTKIVAELGSLLAEGSR